MGIKWGQIAAAGGALLVTGGLATAAVFAVSAPPAAEPTTTTVVAIGAEGFDRATAVQVSTADRDARVEAARVEAERVAAEQAVAAEAARVAAEQAAAAQPVDEPEPVGDEPVDEWAGKTPVPFIVDPNPENAAGGFYDTSQCPSGSASTGPDGVPYCD